MQAKLSTGIRGSTLVLDHYLQSYVMPVSSGSGEAGRFFTGQSEPQCIACVINNILAVTRDFKQCGILTSVGSDEPVQPPFKLRNSK